ncbi:hypothetical protein DFLDMN_000917 [Cupriavidus sp. H19C3]
MNVNATARREVAGGSMRTVMPPRNLQDTRQTLRHTEP